MCVYCICLIDHFEEILCIFVKIDVKIELPQERMTSNDLC